MAEIVPLHAPGSLQEASQGLLETLPGTPSFPVVETTPQVPLLPASGFLQGVRTIGRGLGWVTWPLWRPVVEIISDTKRIPNLWRIPAQHLQGWKAKAQADMALWDGWTAQERASVVRQQSVWVVSLLVCSLVFLVLPYTGFVPITVLGLAWWARSHNWHWPKWATDINPKWQQGNPVPHWDVVRWLLGLRQLPEG
jgi:hypothetical protein